MSSYFTHEFEAVIDEFGVGKSRKVWYRVVFMPSPMESELPFETYPRLRIDGEIADIPINSAFMPTGDGRRYLIVSPHVLKEAGLGIGDAVTVRFRIADQNHVDVPDTLVKALHDNARADAVWQSLTAGKKRALAFHVAGAKTQPTADRRASEAIHALLEKGGRLR